MGFNPDQIKQVAAHELQNLGRTSFSSNGFTKEEISAIASAISAAIEAYDKQKDQ
jgi:hypothetical protein